MTPALALAIGAVVYGALLYCKGRADGATRSRRVIDRQRFDTRVLVRANEALLAERDELRAFLAVVSPSVRQS